MILGLLSDTHGRVERTALAIALLEQAGAEAFVHCGDVGGETVFDQFAGRRAWFVWGNTDAFDPMLERYAESLGFTPSLVAPALIEADGRTVAVYHGHEPHFHRMIRAIQSHDLAAFGKLTDKLDYIIYGHTHRAADARVGRVRLINPGALERAQPHTVATLDLERDTLQFWRVDEGGDAPRRPVAFVPR